MEPVELLWDVKSNHPSNSMTDIDNRRHSGLTGLHGDTVDASDGRPGDRPVGAM